MSPSDVELLGRWQVSRDAEAFRTLAERHSAMVYATCRRILRNGADAEEVAQECLLNLSVAPAGKLRSLGAWLHTLATRRSLDRLRADKRRALREDRYVDLSNRSEAEAWDDLQELVDEAIAGLPDKYRGPVVSHFLENETHAVIAQREGLTRTTVTRRIARGVEEIRKQLRRRGVEVASVVLGGLLACVPAEAAPATFTQALGKLAVSGNGPRAAVGVVSQAADKPLYLNLGVVATTATVVVAGLWFVLGTSDSSGGRAAPPVAEVAPVPEMTTRSERADPEVEVPATERSAAIAAAAAPDASIPSAPVGASVFGRVVNVAGNGVEGAQVLLQGPRSGARISYGRANQLTDAAGRFEIRKISPVAELHLAAKKESAGQSSRPVTLSDVRAGDKYDVELVLHEAVISGEVVYADGRPAPHAEVVAEPHVAQGFALPRGEADERSRFALRGLFEGTYELKARDAGRRFPRTGVAVSVTALQSVNGVRLVLEESGGAYIAGVVVDPEGRRVPGAHVAAHMPRPPWTSNWAFSDEDGTFWIDGLEEGAYSLQSQHLDYGFALVRNVETYTEDTIITVEPRGRIEVVVVDGLSGLPVDSFRIARDVPIDQETWWMKRRDYLEFEDPNGRFALDSVEPGTARIAIEAEGYAPREHRVELPAGDTLTGVVIELSPAAIISGRVLDENGDGIVGASVFVGPLPSPPAREPGFTRSGAGGAFEIVFDPVSDTLLSVYHHAYAPSWADVSADTSTVNVVLVDGATVKGTVFVNGEPTSEAHADVIYPMSQERFGTRTVFKVGEDGDFEFGGVVPGVAMIYASILPGERYGDRQRYVPLETVSGGDYTVDIDVLIGQATLSGRVVRDGVPWPDAALVLTNSPAAARRDTAAMNTGGPFDLVQFQSDRQGRFKIEGLPGGDWTLTASTAEETFMMDVYFGQSETVDIVFDAGQ